MNPVQEVVAVVVLWLFILATAVGCGPQRVSSAPARPYLTWRVVLQTPTGATARVVELPRLFPILRVTACDVAGVREASTLAPARCAGLDALEARAAIYRFVSLEIESMTAVYREARP